MERNPIDSFPLCQLYNYRIVDVLPKVCPLREPDAFREITKRKTAAYQSGDSLAIDRTEVCSGCVGGMLRHEAVRRLLPK